MSFLDDLLGNTAADASRKAAADTYAKQQAATQGLTQFGQTYADQFGGLAKGYQPWQQTGQDANDAVRRLVADPSSVRSLPGYQFGLDQGTHAIDHSALANGNLFSGKTGKALQSFGTNYADKTYGDQLSRLLGISQQGLGATQAYNQTVGQGLQGQLGANTSAYGGNMTAAGTIGQGDVAAANAKTKGMQNLFNLGGSILGAGLSGGMGGGLGSLFGGASYGGGNFLNSAYGGSSSNPLEGLSASDYGPGY
jgi:hypothetical protein